MTSILYPNEQAAPDKERPAPGFFHDLGMDALAATMFRGKEKYLLHEFFQQGILSLETIKFRQDVMHDIQKERVSSALRGFSRKFNNVRDAMERLPRMTYQLQKEKMFIDTVNKYCDAVVEMTECLHPSDCKSEGMVRFFEYASKYMASKEFVFMRAEAQRIHGALERIHYTTQTGPHVIVSNYAGQADFSHEIEETFSIFNSSGSQHAYEFQFSEGAEMNRIESTILELVAAINKQEFHDAAAFFSMHQNFIDAGIANVEREAQFYIAYHDVMVSLQSDAMPFCYPEMVATPDGSHCLGTFDLVLALKLKQEGNSPVGNDFLLQPHERMLVVTGPNQGGKTTYARTAGQIHHLAGLGLPVPGKEARLCVFDNIFTHFEREETHNSLHGKLQDDLVRIHDILANSTARSIIIINEIFASTTFRDALALSSIIARQILDLDARCVWVTFIAELATTGTKTVSMASCVAPDNPAQRTYRIERRNPDGVAYAISIAEKYGLTDHRIRERLGSQRREKDRGPRERTSALS